MLVVFLTGCNETKNKPFELIDSFIIAVENKDADKIDTMLDSKQDINWTLKDTEQFIQYLLREKSTMQQVIQVLVAQADVYTREEISKENPIRHIYSEEEVLGVGAIYLAKKEEKYSLHVRPYKLTIDAPYDSVISVAEKTVEAKGGESVKLELIFPGEHEIVATAKNNQTQIAKETVILNDVGMEEVKVVLVFSEEGPQESMLVENSKQCYQWSCASCHGNDLLGASEPRLDTIGDWISEEELFRIIREGEGEMPGGLLSDEHAQTVMPV